MRPDIPYLGPRADAEFTKTAQQLAAVSCQVKIRWGNQRTPRAGPGDIRSVGRNLKNLTVSRCAISVFGVSHAYSRRARFDPGEECLKGSFYETSEETYELMTQLPVYGLFGFRIVEAVAPQRMVCRFLFGLFCLCPVRPQRPAVRRVRRGAGQVHRPTPTQSPDRLGRGNRRGRVSWTKARRAPDGGPASRPFP